MARKKAFNEALQARLGNRGFLPVPGNIDQSHIDEALASGAFSGEERESQTVELPGVPRGDQERMNRLFNFKERAERYNADPNRQGPRRSLSITPPRDSEERTSKVTYTTESEPAWKRAGFGNAEEHAKELHELYTGELAKDEAERVGRVTAFTEAEAKATRRATKPAKPEVKEETPAPTPPSGETTEATKEDLSGLSPEELQLRGQIKENKKRHAKIKLYQSNLKTSQDWLKTHTVQTKFVDKNTGEERVESRSHGLDAFVEHAKKHPDVFNLGENPSPADLAVKHKAYTDLRKWHIDNRNNQEKALKKARGEVYSLPYTHSGSSVFEPNEEDPGKTTSEGMEMWAKIAMEKKDEKMATQLWEKIYDPKSGHQGVVPMRTPSRKSTDMADAPEEIGINCINKECFNPVMKGGGNTCASCDEKGIDNPRVVRDERTEDEERLSEAAAGFGVKTPEFKSLKRKEKRVKRQGNKATKAAATSLTGMLQGVNRSGNDNLADVEGPSAEDLEATHAEMQMVDDLKDVEETTPDLESHSMEDEQK